MDVRNDMCPPCGWLRLAVIFWGMGLSVPFAGLSGSGGIGIVPDAIDQQAGREFAVQPVGLAQFSLQSRDLCTGLYELLLQVRIRLRVSGIPQHGAMIVVKPFWTDVREGIQDFWKMLPEVLLAFLVEPLAEFLRIYTNNFSKFCLRYPSVLSQEADAFVQLHAEESLSPKNLDV